MIAPILGESFVRSASLDNGRNGLASIGSTSINTDASLGNSISSIAEAMRKTPEHNVQYLKNIGENLLGTQAKDEHGNIIADSYQADGLYGKKQQRDSIKIGLENKQKMLNENIDKINKQQEAVTNEYNTNNDLVKAMKQTITNQADQQIVESFGNVGSFKDVKDNLDNYFLKVAGLDRQMAVEGWRKGQNNSQVYNELVKSGKMSDADFQKLMAYSNKVNNIEADMNNALNGELNQEQIGRLYEQTAYQLGNMGYNPNQSTYLAGKGIQIGINNLEEDKYKLKINTFLNSQQKGQLEAQAIALQNQMEEQKRFNDAQIQLGKQKNAILAQGIKQQKQENIIPQTETVKMEVIDWEKGSAYNYGDDKVVITTSNGNKFVANKEAYTLDNESKKLIPVEGYNGDTNLTQLRADRKNVQEENQMIADYKNKFFNYANIMEKYPTDSIQYKEALSNAEKDYAKLMDYFGVDNKDRNIDLLIADQDSNVDNSLLKTIKGLGGSIVGGISKTAKYRNIGKNLDELLETYRQDTNSYSYLKTIGGMTAAGATIGAFGGPKTAAIGGIIGGGLGTGYSLTFGEASDNTGYTQKDKDEIGVVSKEDMITRFQPKEILTNKSFKNYWNSIEGSTDKEKEAKLMILARDGDTEAKKVLAQYNISKINIKDVLENKDVGSKELISYANDTDKIAKLLGIETAEVDNDISNKAIKLTALYASQNQKISTSKDMMEKTYKMIYKALDYGKHKNGSKFAEDVKKYKDEFSGLLVKGYNVNSPISIYELIQRGVIDKLDFDTIGTLSLSLANAYYIK